MRDPNWIIRCMARLEFLDRGAWSGGERSGPTFPPFPTPAYVRLIADGRLMWWAKCLECFNVDLFHQAQLWQGEICGSCSDTIGFRSFEAASPNLVPKAQRMYPMLRQREACAAMMIGGLEAVEAIARQESGAQEPSDDRVVEAGRIRDDY